MVDLEFLESVFINACRSAIKNQNSDGSMPSGFNGPYKDPETPIRNTAHWITSFAKAYELTADKIFLNGAKYANEYIISQWEKGITTFNCRDKEGKDSCNGLIGQAWVIEGLVNGYKVIKNDNSINIATSLFENHEFSNKSNLWYRVEPDGRKIGFDYTFNHQLWFAMSGLMINHLQENQNVNRKCNEFMSGLDKVINVHKNGRILQDVKSTFCEDYVKPAIKKIVRRKEIRYKILKEIGYHGFNTFAFSKIKEIKSDFEFFSTPKYKSIIKYMFSHEYQKGILISKYGFEYNPPGFELLYTVIKNKDIDGIDFSYVSDLVNLQLKKCYNKNNYQFSDGAHDPNTSSARICELSYAFRTE